MACGQTNYINYRTLSHPTIIRVQSVGYWIGESQENDECNYLKSSRHISSSNEQDLLSISLGHTP